MLTQLNGLKKVLMLSLLVLSLNGCESISGTKSYCSVADIITVSKDDVLTEQTTKELLIHNVTYDAICG
ncbi:MAG: hypothetical protein GOVbin707_40 [Prokaryotic dsDNA virus sp.]|nr:MAG: hypothetical protein GOVbin707_40 [Prokaryotic dsDNA virus sp.]|tara:strand:- start:10002 stop:10208 length:207 start_codon:yes stop_codon:yes gene_type:complete